MAFVDKQHKIARKIIEQRIRRFARLSAVEIARIIFYSAAITYFLHHFGIVRHAFADTLRLDKLAVVGKIPHAFVHILFDCQHGFAHGALLHRVMRRRKNRDVFEFVDRSAAYRLEFAYTVYFVAEKFHAHRKFARRRGKNIHRVALHAETGAFEFGIVALVIDAYQAPQQFVALYLHAGSERHRQPVIFFGRAQPVNTRHRSHHYRIAALRKRTGGAVTELVYLVVYRHVFFYISIGAGYIRFGLIIIVVRHEKFHAVFGKKFAHFVAKLRGKGFVVRQNERGAVYVRYHVCHGKSFSAAGNAQKHLTFESRFEPFGKRRYRRRLVARGRITAYQLEFALLFHTSISFRQLIIILQPRYFVKNYRGGGRRHEARGNFVLTAFTYRTFCGILNLWTD